MTMRWVQSTVTAGLLAFGAQAQATVFNIDLTGVVANASTSSFTSGGTQYDQWYLALSGLDSLNAITVAQGDTINATVTLDQLFTIPASQNYTFVGLVFQGSSFPAINTGVTGSTTLFNGANPSASASAGTTTSSQLVNSVVFFPPDNGTISFDSLVSSFTIYDLAQSATLESSALTYTLVSDAGAVPEPASWAMMLIGFGALGGVLRSRRQTVHVTA